MKLFICAVVAATALLAFGSIWLAQPEMNSFQEQHAIAHLEYLPISAVADPGLASLVNDPLK
jgi:hypothetical protein